jgi:hypothetical protein
MGDIVRFGAAFDATKLNAGVRSANGKLKGLEAQAEANNAKFRTMAARAAVAGAALAGFALAARKVIAELRDLATRGLGVEGVARAVEKATGGQLGSMLALRDATRGLVSDFDLMTAYNRALALGAVENTEQFSRLADVASNLGRALGVDATQAVLDLAQGIGRQSIQILDNLGITVRAEDAYAKYAAALGTTAEALDSVQRKEAFRAEALRQAEAAVSNMGLATGGAGEAWRHLDTAMQNATDSFARVINDWDGLANAVDRVADAVQGVADNMPGVIAGLRLGFGLTTGIMPAPAGPRAQLPPDVMPEGVPGARMVGGVVAPQRIAAIPAPALGPDPAAVARAAEVNDALDKSIDQQAHIAEFWTEVNRRSEAAVQTEADLAVAEFNRLQREADQVAELQEVWRTGFAGMSMLLSDFITGGIQGFEDLGTAMLRMFQRLALESAFKSIGEAIGLPGLPSFQFGGYVPGPIGMPQLAVVHGGEFVSPARNASPEVHVHQVNNFNAQALDGMDAVRALYRHKGTIAAMVGEAARESSGFRHLLR